MTSCGGSSELNLTVAVAWKTPAGSLRLVNDAAASEEFGTIWMPEPVSMCTARQLTSTTLPWTVPTESQSPILNGCSNSSSRPEMTPPTAFCSARPITIEVTPSAVISPATSASHTHWNSRARPTTIRPSRAMSTKIDGIRSRQVPSRGLANSATFNALSSRQDDQEPEHGGDHSRPDLVGLGLEGQRQQCQQGRHRDDPVAQQSNRLGGRRSPPGQRAQDLGQDDQDHRYRDGQRDGPADPGVGRCLHQDSIRHTDCDVPATSTVPASAKTTLSCIRSRTAWLT